MTSQHVLVIGIDGTRLDYLLELATPHIDRVAAEGFLAPVWIEDGTPTISGPCWATIVTGTTIERHNIHGNDFTGHRLAEHPDFLSVLAGRPGVRTYLAAGGWAPLGGTDDGGPMFARPSRVSFARFDHDECEAGDDATLADAERILATEDFAASFVYLGANDEVAHEHGCHDLYREAIERSDAKVGRLLAAIEARPGRAAEEWTVILVTDHGHVTEGGHGGPSVEERTAWIAASGPGIVPGGDYGALRHVDVAAHIYAALGVDPEVVLDGKPFAVAA